MLSHLRVSSPVADHSAFTFQIEESIGLDPKSRFAIALVSNEPQTPVWFTLHFQSSG